MFVYYDSNGVLKEIVNDKAIRQGDSGVNKIYFFIEGADPQTDSNGVYNALSFISGHRTFYSEEGQVIGAQDVSFSITTVEKEIPFNKKRELQFFKYYTKYKMFVITVPNDLTNESQSIGLRIRMVVSEGDTSDDALDSDDEILTLGFLVFHVEFTGGEAIITEDTAISIAQWNYLIANMSTPESVADYITPLLAGKLDKRTNALTINTSYAYVVTNNNGSYVQGVMQIDGTSATAYTIPTRRANGELVIGAPTANAHAVNLSYANSHYVPLSGTKTIADQTTFSGKAIFSDANLYNGYLTTNSKNYFVRVGVTTGQYVTYKLPYNYSDVGAQTYTLATESYVDAAIQSLGTVFNYRGSKTVSEINALPDSTFTTGDVYNVTDSGTLTKGSVVVITGDNVVWDGTKWDKLAGTVDLSGYVPTSRTIAGIALSGDILSSELTDALVFATDSDILSIMED